MLENYRDEMKVLEQEVRANRLRHRRYLPQSLRDAIGRLAQRVSAEGVPLSVLSKELGVTATTLRRYSQACTTKPDEPPIDFVPVSLAAQPSNTPIVLVSPAGWRVEAVDIATAVDLLRALS